jgi:hypothetical protein
MTTSDSDGIQRGMFQLIIVPVLSDVIVIFFSSIVVVRPNGTFWVVPLLHSVSDINKMTVVNKQMMECIRRMLFYIYIQVLPWPMQ